MLALPAPRRRRRPSLTPMIDVVFLLLVFFMLAARFGADLAVPVTLAGQGGAYAGPPRLVTIDARGLTLNGAAVTPAALPQALARLMQDPDDIVLLRPAAGADVQRLVDVITLLNGAGVTRLAVLPPAGADGPPAPDAPEGRPDPFAVEGRP